MKIKKIFPPIIAIFITVFSFSQVGINTTSPNATLDIQASNQATPASNDGILIPKVDEFPITDPAAAQDGMLIYVSGTGSVSKGFYYWENSTTSWRSFGAVRKIDDLEDGKSDVDGSGDGSSIYLGIDAGANDDATNNQNVGIGFNSLKEVDGAVSTEGNANVAVGYISLQSNTTGFSNTGIGQRALRDNDTGDENTSIGQESMLLNTTGHRNVSIGVQALSQNDSGVNNVAVGMESMRYNDDGDRNTALGYFALKGSQAANSGNAGSGLDNVAVGQQSLEALESGDRNTGLGALALNSNVSGEQNVAVGYQAGFTTTGNLNVFIGYQAGRNETGSNKLYLDNSLTTTPLIYGEFDTNLVAINGDLEVTQSLVTNDIKVGANGTVVANIIKITVNQPAFTVIANSYNEQLFTVTGTTFSAGGSVIVSPNHNLANGVFIVWARISADDTVQVKFYNNTGSDINITSKNWFITVFE